MAKKTATKKKASSKKNGAKKQGAGEATMTKAGFVRAQPRTMATEEVIAEAAEAGLTIDAQTVYKHRSKKKGAKKGGAKKAASGTPAKKSTATGARRGKAPDKKNRVLELKGQNPTWTAAQIAEEAGCSTATVYAALGGSKKPTASVNDSATPTSPVSRHLDHVRALRGVILHVGIDRAKEMMDQIVKDLMVLA